MNRNLRRLLRAEVSHHEKIAGVGSLVPPVNPKRQPGSLPRSRFSVRAYFRGGYSGRDAASSCPLIVEGLRFVAVASATAPTPSGMTIKERAQPRVAVPPVMGLIPSAPPPCAVRANCAPEGIAAETGCKSTEKNRRDDDHGNEAWICEAQAGHHAETKERAE